MDRDRDIAMGTRRVLVSVGDFDMSDTITRIRKAERKREKRNT